MNLETARKAGELVKEYEDIETVLRSIARTKIVPITSLNTAVNVIGEKFPIAVFIPVSESRKVLDLIECHFQAKMDRTLKELEELS